MRITGYRTLTTVHRWGRPIGDINGYVDSGVTAVPVVLVETDAGLTGVGLGSSAGFEAVFPAILGEDPRGVIGLYDRMLAAVFKAGHAGAVFGAIGALDMALWDLKAKAAEQPLWRMLGARDRVVRGYASGLDGPLGDEELASLHASFADRGFRAAKLKGGLDLAGDLRRLRLVHEVYQAAGVPPRLMLDANEAWSRKEAIAYVQRIEEQVDLAWIEEPVRRWDADGHALIGRAVRAAVATGENLTGLEQFRPLVQAGAVDVVQTGSMWGVTHFLRVSALAHAFDLLVSPVGYNCNPLAHAAAAVPNHIATEVQDLATPVGITVDQEFTDGSIVLGDQPGLGLTLDETAIAALTEPADWGKASGPHVRPDGAGKRLLVPERHDFAPALSTFAPPGG